MTTQQKIDRIERNGYKVVFGMNGGVFVEKGMNGRKFGSVTEAHRHYFGY